MVVLFSGYNFYVT